MISMSRCAVRAEALPGRDAVVVDDAQGAEAHVRGVVVVGERERVVRVEPAVVGVAALGGGAKGHHGENIMRLARTL